MTDFEIQMKRLHAAGLLDVFNLTTGRFEATNWMILRLYGYLSESLTENLIENSKNQNGLYYDIEKYLIDHLNKIANGETSTLPFGSIELDEARKKIIKIEFDNIIYE